MDSAPTDWHASLGEMKAQITDEAREVIAEIQGVKAEIQVAMAEIQVVKSIAIETQIMVAKVSHT